MSSSSSRQQYHHHQQHRSRSNEYASTTKVNAYGRSRDGLTQHIIAGKRFIFNKQRRLGQNRSVLASFTSSSSSSCMTCGENKKQKTKTDMRTKTSSGDDKNTNNKKRAIPLPIWESRKGSNFKLQYALDGNKLRLLSPEEARDLNLNGAFSFDPLHLGRKKRAFLRQIDNIRDSFFPQKTSVTSDYWDYAKYRFTQRIASSCMTVLATQQMLAAIGLGASRSIPAAAALNWVLKDGLGRLGKLSVATNFGRSFDSDVKRLRFSSSLVYTGAVFIETITPFFPKHFLAIATVANVGKSIGITTGNVVRPPIQKTFALEENLGEIAAKTSAQQVLADNIGLALGVSVMKFQTKFVSLALQRAVPLALFPILASIDLVSIHKQLKSVQLRTVNKERAEIIAEAFVREKTLATQLQVAEKERLLFPARLDASALPLRVTSLGNACSSLDALASAFKDDVRRPYVLSYEPYVQKKGNILSRIFMRDRKPLKYKGRALLALSHRATSKDVLQGILQVAHIRNLPFRKDLNEKEAYDWAVSESSRRAKADVNKFYNQIVSNGWQANLILLSSNERMPYFLDEKEIRSLLKFVHK
jgi:hypothetical protein